MGKAKKEVGRVMCAKKLWLLHISLEKWPEERVECTLLLFFSIRLSGGGGKHGALPPVDYSSDTTKPPYSHVQEAHKHMYSS